MKFNPLGKNLLAIGLGLTFVVLLEFTLFLFNVTPLSKQDPFVGFAGTSPLFVEESAGSFVVNPAKSAYFNTPQTFAMPKPAGTFRIVVFGGSTTYGRPYFHQTSFGAWLEKLIEKYAAGGINVEVINAGGISYASYRDRRLMEELAIYDPDLFVVYSGHNEFLEARTFADLRSERDEFRSVRVVAQKSRIYSVLARLLGKTASGVAGPTTLKDEVGATLEHIGGTELYHRDPEFRAGVIRQYQYEMNAMVQFCKEQKIPLVISTLPSNLSGVSPFKSEHALSLNSSGLKDWEIAYKRGRTALFNGNYLLALQAFADAEAIDGTFAELYFYKGQAYERLGMTAQAYLAYDRAREEDIVPLRAINEFNQIIRSIASQEKVPLADVEKTFLRISPGNIPGENLFVDHVHPSIEGNQLVAWVILTAAANAELIPLDAQTWQGSMEDARLFLRKELERVPQRYQALGLWGVGRLYFWAGKYPEAYTPLRQAWEFIQDQPEMARQLGELELVRGDIPAALNYLDAAEKLSPGNLHVAVARASAFNRLGRPEDALALLRKQKDPENDQSAGLFHVSGESLMQLGRFTEAADYYRRSVATAPKVAAYRLSLAEANKRTGDTEAARQAYKEYLDVLPNQALAAPLEKWLASP
jgi:tetratricopeptide (TPR) repeat protein